MALTAKQKLAREGKMTGSRIGAIMSGDPEQMYDLWLELTGDPSWKPKDYSGNWAVQLGAATEQFHLDWLQRRVGEINRRGELIKHPSVKWAAVTLDGWAKHEQCPVEAKHTGGFEHIGTIQERYMPQMQWTAYCTQADEVMFSAIMGAKEPVPVFVRRDNAYIDTLVEQAHAFMECVFDLREPVANPYVEPPKPVFSRVVDMSKSNSWGAYAERWIEYKPFVHDFNEAAKGIKKLVPDDAKEAIGHGIVCKRSKSGSLTIKLEGEDNGKDESTND